MKGARLPSVLPRCCHVKGKAQHRALASPRRLRRARQSPSPAPPARTGGCHPRASSRPWGVSGLTEGLLPPPNTATAPPSPRQKPPPQNKDAHPPLKDEGTASSRAFPRDVRCGPGTCLPAAPIPAPQGSPAQPPVLFITQTPHVALRRGTDPSHSSSPPGAARTRALCLIRIRSSLLLLHFCVY